MSLEEALSKVGLRDARTQKMRLEHVFHELYAFLRDERANLRLRGPRIQYFNAGLLKSFEERIHKLKEELESISYIDVD